MGIHRNVIHPKFGNFILLGSVLIDREVDVLNESTLDFNPCLECKLCVAACPVGAISKDGYFNFSACMTHNYREFMGGFIDWVGAVTNSQSMHEYQEKMTDGETVSTWQSLTYGANYKAAYCIAVCPAGEDIIGPFLTNKAAFIKQVVNPLQEKKETIYVVKGSDAAEHASKRFPNKHIKYVQSGLNPRSAEGFIFGAKLVFQPNQSKGINARYHFLLRGKSDVKATFVIKDQQLEIIDGHIGKADLFIDSLTQDWLNFTQGKLNIVWALFTKKIRLSGSIQHLKNFGRCFPST
jgi:Fe-S-cluster-containing hydrogenase component 2